MEVFNNRLTRLIIISLTLICFNMITPEAFARNVNTAAEYLSDRGVKLYKRSDYAGAAHELSKAIILDPYNKKAEKYLKKIYATRYVYDRPFSLSQRLAEFMADRDHYKEEVIAVFIDDVVKGKAIVALDQEISNLQFAEQEKVQEIEELQMAIENLTGDIETQTAHIDSFQEIVETREQEYAALVEQQKSQDAQREKELASLRKKFDHVRNLYEEQAGEYEEHIQNLKRTIASKDAEVQKALARGDLAAIQKEDMLDAHREKIEHLKFRLSKTEDSLKRIGKEYEQRIAQLDGNIAQLKGESQALKDQIVQKDIKIVNTIHDLTQKNDVIASLDGSVEDLKELLSDCQNLDFSKDGTILSLGDELGALKGCLEERRNILAAKFEENKLLKEELVDVMGELIDHREELSVKEDKIQTLAEELKASEVGSQDVQHTAAGKVVTTLREDLAEVKLLLIDREGLLIEKDSEIGSLRNKLEENRERQSLTEKIIQEKEERIRELEEKMETKDPGDLSFL